MMHSLRCALLFTLSTSALACSSSTTADDASGGAGALDGGADASLADVTPDGPVTVRVLAINDFHGNLAPPTGSTSTVLADANDPIATLPGAKPAGASRVAVPAGGAAYLAAHLAALRAENPASLFVSAGDLTGGSPLLSGVEKDEPTVRAMNLMGLDDNAVGNHEFDRGVKELLRLANGGCELGDCTTGQTFEGAKFHYLAANVVDDTTKMTLFPAYEVREIGGVKIGLVGMTLEGTPDVTLATNVSDLTFAPEAKTVNALVPALKAAGAQAIVVLVHQGGTSSGTYDGCTGFSAGALGPILSALDPAVDVVVSAHTHAAYNCTVDGRIVTSGASFGRVITAIDLTIDPAQGKVVDKRARNVAVTREVTPDPAVSALIASVQMDTASLANRVVGYIAGDLPAKRGTRACETPLGDVIADSQLEATRAAGAVVAFMNIGGIRADILASGAGKTSGTVTYADAFAAQPFQNNLVTLSLRGADILDLLDAQLSGANGFLQVSSGFTYAYGASGVDHASVKIGGTTIDPAATYRVTANAFLAGGGDGFTAFTRGTSPTTGPIDLDAFDAYLAAHGTQAAPLPVPPGDRYAGDACGP